MQGYLLGALRDASFVGSYSNWHDNAVYKLGYDHPETIRLAYMQVQFSSPITCFLNLRSRFCAVLDGSKTGLTVDPEVLQKDRASYNCRPPAWKETTEKKKEDGANQNLPNVKRLGRVCGIEFIMDAIQKQGKMDYDMYLGKYEDFKKREGVDTKLDDDLTGPWRDAQERAERNRDKFPRMLEELELIAAHVHEIRIEHRKMMRWQDPKTPASSHKHGGKADFTKKPIVVRQDELRDLSEQFAESPNVEDLVFFDKASLARVRASYAYLHDYKETRGAIRWTAFPFDMAMRELCAIKAGENSKTLSADFYNTMTMSSHVKAISSSKTCT